MARRPRHYDHVLRVAAVFGVGFVSFLIVRALLVPSDFGVYGFFRAGALDDARARPVSYAGEAACVDCHNTVADERRPSKHAQVRCEACHGPLVKHTAGEMDTLPQTPDSRRLCVTCHTKIAGRPAWFPQVVVADHAGDAECTACHKPHNPKIQ
jgi:predicted CXXCH cytochrome family protein